MSAFEYKVVPAPAKGLKAKGLRATADRFAHALESVMNELGADGWEYLRADTLPCEERDGLMSKTTVFQHMLVFRRPLVGETESTAPAALPAPARPEPPLETPVPVVAATADDPGSDDTPPASNDIAPPRSVPAPAPRPNIVAE